MMEIDGEIIHFISECRNKLYGIEKKKRKKQTRSIKNNIINPLKTFVI